MGEILREKDKKLDELIESIFEVTPEEAREIINEFGVEEKEDDLIEETQVGNERD